MRTVFIANPAAGRGRTESFVTRFGRLEGGARPEILWSERTGHATELARNAASRADVMTIFGGDGTVHEVVNGLMPAPIPIVVVPTGSGNDFASIVGCPTTPAQLREVLTDAVGVYLDVIDCGDRYCANSIGMGFEALVTKESLAIRRLRGLPLYLVAAARALRRFECVPMAIDLDGAEQINGERLMVSAGNGVRAGGGFYLTPDALADDGMIDFCIVGRLGRLRILSMLPRAISGRHTGKRGVTMRRAAGATITAARPYHMHIDGEYVGERSDPLRLRVRTRVLPVLCRKGMPTKTKQPPGPLSDWR